MTDILHRPPRLGRALIPALLILMMLTSCSTTRHLEQGQLLLRDVRIDIDQPTADVPLPEDLLSYIGQRPNRRVFGLFYWPLGIYSLSRKGSNAWLDRRLRQWGEAPVIFSPQEAEYSVSTLSTAMYNKGYMRATTTLELDTIAPSKVRAIYHITLGERFSIAHHESFIADSAIRAALFPADTLEAQRLYGSKQYASLLQVGAPLAPELLQAERRRITSILRAQGYWGFREEHIRFEVDTLAGARSSWVHTHIDSTSRVYRIGQVRILHALQEGQPPSDSTSIDSVEVLRGATHRLRPKVLAMRNHIAPGSLYSQDVTSRTYSTLSDLGALRNVSILYRPDSNQSAPTLDVDIITQAERSKEFTADVIGTHSGDNLGIITSLSFAHSNIFGGSERFKLLGRVGYEELKGFTDNHHSYGLEASLSVPGLALPFVGGRLQRPLRGQTTFALSYDYLSRPEFRRDLLSANLSYSWVHARHPALRYTSRLLEVDYMHFGYIGSTFLSSIPEYTRMLSYRDQFVVSTAFTLHYNSAADPRRLSSPWVHNLRLHLQSAGNALYALSSLLKAERDEYGAYSLLNINFAQFVRGELDYSGLYRLGGKNALAYHAAVSAVVPYRNSRMLPVDFRYFSGGSSSVRGWGVRELGPGSMSRDAGTGIFYQVGDIKVDLSLELRLRIARSWELATFVDAGNIWTIRPYEHQPGGHFEAKRFYKELALSTGAGLRWDFDYFIVRLDAGLKLYDPQRASGERWVLGRHSLGSLTALHIALGYPF